jgi:hypothetical protein
MTTLPHGVHRRIEDGRGFVVLDGAAVIEFDDRDSLLYVRPGTVCELTPDASTRWTVPETITFVVPPAVRPGSVP